MFIRGLILEEIHLTHGQGNVEDKVTVKGCMSSMGCAIPIVADMNATQLAAFKALVAETIAPIVKAHLSTLNTWTKLPRKERS